MEFGERVDAGTLSLPDGLRQWIADAALFESSGQSGARTIRIGDGGAYLKIAERGALLHASRMQSYFADKRMAPPVLCYLSSGKDYLVTQGLTGQDGTSPNHLAEPERLSEVFGQCLRALHEVDARDCPVRDRMSDLIRQVPNARFNRSHLEDIASYIGEAVLEKAPDEIACARDLIRSDVLIHGDYCLPNIILNDWSFQGLIDVADGRIGDRHYDLVWGLWTLNWNLKSQRYGHRFLDAYGRERIDRGRLRVCGLLAAMD